MSSSLEAPTADSAGAPDAFAPDWLESGVLGAVGRTPLVSLRRALPESRLRLYAKIEGLNPGGSAKDRPALGILREGIRTGAVRPETVVVESSSGNMGIGLAQACRYLGIRFVCVVDARTTAQHVHILRTYGAQVDVVDQPDPETGEFLPARIRRVSDLVDSLPHAFWPNQFANEANPASHYHGTMREIAQELDGRVDYLFCATSTCGTLRGCSDYVRGHDLPTRVVAVDALGSVIFGGPRARRRIPGLGSGLVPELLRPGLADLQVHVSDLDCVVGCRRLVTREALLVGGSAGGVFTALERMSGELPEGATCVLVFCDRGDRYLDTIFSDTWVTEHFGDVSHRWREEGSAPWA